MAKFNTVDKRGSRSPGPVQTEKSPTLLTGNGAPGFARDAKSDLFLLATGSMFGENKFYATADDESKRFATLVREVTRVDPAWMLNFITWLCSSGNMRTAAVVASVEAAWVAKDFTSQTDADPGSKGFGRLLASAGLGRVDELGEALAYWVASRGNKRFPKPLKRGVADAAVKLINEYSAMKYSGTGKAWTLAQVLNVTHPVTSSLTQSDLFGYLVAKEYGEVEIPESLLTLRNREALMRVPVDKRREYLDSNFFKAAGMTWEAVAGWLQGPMDKAAWEAIIPSMGYMALLRNLRNFDQAGVSDTVARQVALKLGDPDQVARAKQFPFRFLAALRAAPSLRWASALSYAMDLSLQNIPALPGRTLVMVDTSGSMADAFSEHSEMKMWDAAALFGIALALRNEHVDLVSYSDRGRVFQVTKGADTLGELRRWGAEGYNIGHGTNTFGILKEAYRSHDRVIILTDEQANPYYGNSTSIVPAGKHLFTFNLAGYRAAHSSTSKYVHAFGGLTDACFSLIPTIEAGVAGAWPWENRA
jgi:hypothetical protein